MAVVTPRELFQTLPWVCAAVLYSPILWELYGSRWKTIDYTHAYFILPLSLWIAWSKRDLLRARAAEAAVGGARRLGDAAALSAIVGGALMFVFGWRQQFLLVSSLSVIPVLLGLSDYLYGGGVMRALLFPVGFLLFLVPPPLGVLDAVTLPMRYGISSTAETILRALDYPLVRSGLVLTIGGHELFMGAPCSGLRSLIAMLALATAYVYFAKGGPRTKLALLSLAIPFALLGNLVRVIALCLVTFYAGQEAAEGLYHDVSGAVIFLVMIGCLIGLEHLLERPPESLEDW